MKNWAAVIGDPIDHSLSPVLHSKAYEILDLPWEYRRYQVDAETLGPFLEGLDEGCRGLSVTMPLKPLVRQYVDHIEGLAKLLRSANTIVIGGGLRAGFNTDVYGITEAFRSSAAEDSALTAALSNTDKTDETKNGRPVILGTGATASSALAALAALGYRKTWIVGRRFAGDTNAFMSANRIGVRAETIPLRLTETVTEAINKAPLVVSTIPPQVTEDLAKGLSPRADALLLDVTYSNNVVPLRRAFEDAGAISVSPLKMLTYQGVAQVKLMTNRDVPFEPIYKAVLSAAHGNV